MSVIDVLLPVKNGERFLQEALDSLAAQTFRDFRLLACDDGSTDATGRILAGETRFPVVIIRHETSRGIATSLNELLEKSSGCTYLARFDGDDVCHPERFARQAAFLQANPGIDILGSSLEVIDAEGRVCEHIAYPLADAGIRAELLFQAPLAHPAVMIRADLMRDPANRYDPRFGATEDYELWCRLSARVRFANLPEPLLRYRRHAAAVGVTRTSVQLAEIRAIRQSHVERLGLTPASRDLLLDALALAPVPSSVSARRAAGLLRELDARLNARSSANYHKRRNDIAFALSLRMTPREKFLFFLSDLRTGRAYLSAKLARLTQGWRQKRRYDQASASGRALARRIRRAIRSEGGDCERDLRVYGDSSQGRRLQFGEQTIIEHGCSFWLSSPAQHHRVGRLIAGKNLFLGFNSRINVHADVTIGDGVSIGANCYLASNNHNYGLPGIPIQSQGFNSAPIAIGDDVWIGCNVVVVAGVVVGKGAVIGAGSVVTRDVPPFEVWAGVPAKKIKDRPS